MALHRPAGAGRRGERSTDLTNEEAMSKITALADEMECSADLNMLATSGILFAAKGALMAERSVVVLRKLSPILLEEIGLLNANIRESSGR